MQDVAKEVYICIYSAMGKGQPAVMSWGNGQIPERWHQHQGESLILPARVTNLSLAER